MMPANPAGSVRGPSHVVKAGKMPVLAPEEARALIDGVPALSLADETRTAALMSATGVW
jgi:hypothetical protein